MPTAPTVDHQTSNPDLVVATRRMAFEEELGSVPRHFAGDGNVALSHFWTILSAVFPEGEEFFVRSVRHFRGDITDPVLKRQVAGFIGQEAMHGREHRAFNEHLDSLGYPVEKIERFEGKAMRFREKLLPAKANLAMTIVIEHWTALLAEKILSDQAVRDSLGHETVRDVYTWHAYEECEHKAVAFDVYRAVGGSERLRILNAKFARYGMLLSIALGLLVAVVTDRASWRRGSLRASWRAIRSNPLVSKDMWEGLKEFEQPGFHPDDRDTSALLAEWEPRLFGAEGLLEPRRIGTAA